MTIKFDTLGGVVVGSVVLATTALLCAISYKAGVKKGESKPR